MANRKPWQKLLPPEELRARKSAGGKAGGARKARPAEVARAAVLARYARERARAAAHAQLLAVAREVGAFLDGQPFTGRAAERARDLTDRLYAAVQEVGRAK